jgi:hypothetical protein
LDLISTQPMQIPAGTILDRWSEKEGGDGVQIDQMERWEQLAVRTRNSIYEITILNGRAGEVLVRGGEFFPVGTAVRLEGSTLGGSILKWRGIYVGLQMEIVPGPVEVFSRVAYGPTKGQKEILLGHKVIKTSPVLSIGVVTRNSQEPEVGTGSTKTRVAYSSPFQRLTQR